MNSGNKVATCSGSNSRLLDKAFKTKSTRGKGKTPKLTSQSIFSN